MRLLKKREDDMSDPMNNALISNLKGRISKILCTKVSLPLEEVSGLEGIYNAIDALILSNRDDTDYLNFNEELMMNSKFLAGTKKKYIKEHIIPLINKVSIKRWERDE